LGFTKELFLKGKITKRNLPGLFVRTYWRIIKRLGNFRGYKKGGGYKGKIFSQLIPSRTNFALHNFIQDLIKGWAGVWKILNSV